MREKILVIKGMGIGDIIVGIPLLRNLRKTFPKAYITVLKQPGPGSILLKKCKYIDEVIDTESLHGTISQKIRIIRMLRKRKFDIIIDSFPTTKKTALFSWMIGSKIRIGFANNAYSFLYTTKIPFDRKKSIVDIEEGIVRQLGYRGEYNKKLELCIKPKKYIHTIKKPIIGIAAGKDIDIVRSWPVEHWAKLADNLIQKKHATIVFIGAETDKERVKKIQSLMKEKSVNLVNKLTLEESISIIKEMKLLITINGGAMHIAAAVKTPVITLNGSSGYFWDAYTDKSISIRCKNLTCMPCESFHCKLSGKNKGLCMQLITEEEVKNSTDKMWKYKND